MEKDLIVNDLSAQEKFPIGTVVEWVKWEGILFKFKSIKKRGMIKGYLVYKPSYEYPYGADILIEEYEKGKKTEKFFIRRTTTFIEMLNTGEAKIIYSPKYKEKLRKFHEENPLVSFPKGTRIWINNKNNIAPLVILDGKIDGVSQIKIEHISGITEWIPLQKISRYSVDDISGIGTLAVTIIEYLS